jgi:hypothetical protein
MAPQRRFLAGMTLIASLAVASCNSHPLTPIHVDSFVEKRDEYRQPDRPPATVDILFMIDNSGSMDEEQANLAANFGAFIDLIVATRADFRIAIISSDMVDPAQSGRFLAKPNNPKILTANTPNLKTIFSENAQLGTMGDGFEKGLAAIKAALSPPLIDNENAGFLRPDAILAVVVLSDEEDCSHPPGAIPEFDGDECVRNIGRMYPTQVYIDFLKGLKGGDASKVFFAAITGPDLPRSEPRPDCVRNNDCTSGRCADGKCCPPNPAYETCVRDEDCAAIPGTECVGKKCLPAFSTHTQRPYAPRSCSCFASGTGLAEPGTRYLDLVKAFTPNSVYASICSADWSQSLADIAGGVVELVCKFPLERFKANPNVLPKAERDLVVKVNNAEVPSSAWNYNCPEAPSFPKGSVSFTSDQCPALSAVVHFFYEPAPNDTPPQTCTSDSGCAATERCGNCGYCERRP